MERKSIKKIYNIFLKILYIRKERKEIRFLVEVYNSIVRPNPLHRRVQSEPEIISMQELYSDY